MKYRGTELAKGLLFTTKAIYEKGFYESSVLANMMTHPRMRQSPQLIIQKGAHCFVASDATTLRLNNRIVASPAQTINSMEKELKNTRVSRSSLFRRPPSNVFRVTLDSRVPGDVRPHPVFPESSIAAQKFNESHSSVDKAVGNALTWNHFTWTNGF
jgi:hypothetical protein